MDMHDKDNWHDGDYFGDTRKFWDGAMQGIDMWVDKMRESQNASTSDEALPIADVVKSLSSENKPRSMGKCMMCGRNNCVCHG